MLLSCGGVRTKLWPVWSIYESGLRYCARSKLSTSSRFYSTIEHSQACVNQHVVCSPYPNIQLPLDDLYTTITKNFSRYGSRIALINGVSGRQYSYDEIAETTVKFSSGLQRLGLVKDDVLAIVAPNLPEYAILYLGTLAAGCVVSPCNPTFTADQLAYQFKATNAKIVATVRVLLPTVREAVAKSEVKKIIVVDDNSRTSTGNLVSFDSLVRDPGSLLNPVPTDPDDVTVLMFTSGTTLPGIPKGVMLTNRSVGANVLQMLHPELLNLKEDTSRVVIGITPFFHSLSVSLLPSLYAGTKLVTLPNFEPESFLSTINKYGINTATLAPPMLLFLAKHQLVEKYDITSMSDIITGAAPIGGKVIKIVSERTRCKLIRQAYGLTETSTITHMMSRSIGMQRSESVGHCVQNMKAKVIDLESGEALPPNKKGEVWLHGPSVMKGYLNNPKATQECLTDDGWFKTGDFGHYDERGLFYISDRLNEIIKVKGSLVSPAELEAILLTQPKITDAAVIGIADEKLGETPKAFVVAEEEISEKEVQQFVAMKVPQHKHLVGGVTFIKKIPKSPSGKILRRVLKHKRQDDTSSRAG